MADSLPRPDERTRGSDLAFALAGLGLLLAWQASGLDILLTRWVGTLEGFPLRSHPLTSVVLHDGARWVSWLLLAALLAAVWRPWGLLRQLAIAERAWIVVTALACAGLITIVKQASTTSCPWSLAEFGGVGSAVYRPHGLSTWIGLGDRGDGGPGRCFPSGHAASAFAFLALGFALRPISNAWARRAGAAVALAGLLIGAAQVLRGAHHASHVLWTAWICWSMTALSHHAWRSWR